MIDLLKRELPSHYKLHRTIVDVPYEITAEEHFDLTDRGLTSIVDYKTGNISFDHSNRTEVQVINYEAYLIGLKGTKFETGRKRCDFILHETGGSCDSFYILNEQTSTKKNIENLSKPILSQVSLNRLVECLSGNNFCRVHRSYIVSLSHINYIERKRIRIDGALIPISDSYLPTLMNKLCMQT